MKKLLKILGWIFVGANFIFAFCVFPMGTPIESNSADSFLYGLGLILFFIILAVAMILELTGVRSKFKKIKNTFLAEVVYWLIAIVLAATCFGICQSLTSKDFQERMKVHNNERDAQAEVAQSKAASESKIEQSHVTTSEVNTTSKVETESSSSLKTAEEEASTNDAKTEVSSSKPSTEAAESQQSSEINKKPPVTTADNDNSESEVQAETSSISASTENNKVNSNSIYLNLSDEQFDILTSAIAKSFYTLKLDKSSAAKIEKDKVVKQCVETIFNYANSNNFELDPDYKVAFAKKGDSISNLSDFALLKNNFIIENHYDSKNRQWVCNIESYSVNPADVVEYNGVKYIDAEGYLAKDVAIYWVQDGKMVKVGKIIDTAINLYVDGTAFPYAVNVEYIDDPYSSGWCDGYILLKFNKDMGDKPMYYVSLLDANRRIAKEEIDYNGLIKWTKLTRTNAKAGTEVFFGVLATKSYSFKIVKVDLKSDMMIVEYPSGNKENKNFSAIVDNKALFIKQ